jgi:hypothetical protein
MNIGLFVVVSLAFPLLWLSVKLYALTGALYRVGS